MCLTTTHLDTLRSFIGVYDPLFWVLQISVDSHELSRRLLSPFKFQISFGPDASRASCSLPEGLGGQRSEVFSYEHLSFTLQNADTVHLIPVVLGLFLSRLLAELTYLYG